MNLTTLEDVTAAAERIADIAMRTPLLPGAWADAHRPLWLKPENLQPIGAFKIRGAANAVARIPVSERARGVVAYSSGNHAQAVAYVAKRFGIPAAIVVPENTPAVKIEATRAHGAEVVVVPITDREIVAERLVAERGATLIPPFDHPDVIAGQGTIGLEIVADLPDVEVVLVPVSGGGLASGVATAIKALCPAARVYGVEPALAGDTAESLAAGRLVRWSTQDRARTIADGLRAEPSELTFAHLRKLLDGIVTVTEEEIRAAVATLATRAHLVAEPSGAVTTAAYLHRAADLPRGRTVAIVSGGNLDPTELAAMLST
ncbi:MAG: pyridoxal-phosphate dependent enzyme [Actinophytocola sp.]|uniref:threonine ammonia-lyase n=1 Tax=Actinophytocola sp. TaxID=1872138 RepID=UPI00132BF28B|nr:threonine/serine dehydratase [Actinophytocola sp.]MPZ84970.1 pyridoxal-phosphate dependent enzyme [Actinophytocola sp.]